MAVMLLPLPKPRVLNVQSFRSFPSIGSLQASQGSRVMSLRLFVRYYLLVGYSAPSFLLTAFDFFLAAFDLPGLG
jgi:predicted metal-binding membrane protein